jgi:zinc transporter, ZIP family
VTRGAATARVPLWVVALVVIGVIAAALAGLAAVGGSSLPERAGPPVEELAVERTVLTPGSIELVLRNTGPDPVQLAQVFVNDSYVDFAGGAEPIGRMDSATVQLRYPWATGQPYVVGLLTSTGLVIEHEIPAAVATPAPDAGFFGVMTLLGIYVGVIPVLLGMLLLPVLRRAGGPVVRLLLAVTVGLLVFLAVDAAIEGGTLAGAAPSAFGGPLLVLLGAAIAFLALTGVDRALSKRASAGATGQRGGFRLACMIAIGIGLHNLGEGLAIGSAYAVGELALGAALVVGFAVHNTTEGLAIVAPLIGHRSSLSRLGGLGLIAGAPAIVGALVGASVNNAALAAVLFGVGVGAVAQVLVQLTPSLRDPTTGRHLDPVVVGGLIAGLVVMYLTSLLVVA